MAQITYDDKVALNVNSDIADINKCNASDMNEIKNVINNTIFIALGLDTNTFSSSTSYAKGSLVIYDNKIYEFTSAHNGAWTGNDVNLVSIVVDANKINQKLFKSSGVSITRNETYIPTNLGYTTVDANQLYCDANFNFRIDTAITGADTVLISGLPKPKKRITYSAVVGSTPVRLKIDENGQLLSDMAIPAGWCNAHVFYTLI